MTTLVFSLTVLAKDDFGPHYVNHTVAASNVSEAEQIVTAFYASGAEELIEFDQAVILDDVRADGRPRILETLGKVYFEE